MKDFTKGCLETVRVDGNRISEKELRGMFCRQCKNHECGNAKWGKASWEERIGTQEDRLLKNPNFGDLKDPRWSHLREIDFPDLLRKAIILEEADRRGDWNLPDSFDIYDTQSESAIEKSDFTIEKSVEKPIDETIVKVSSNTKNVEYSVTIVNGKAVKCNCAAGVRGKNCSHLKTGESLFRSLNDEVNDPPKEQDTIIVQMDDEEKKKMGGVHKLVNTMCNPHGIVLNGSKKIEKKTDKSDKGPDKWEMKEVKPGTVIKI
jgi:hypothetical protein